MKYSALTTRIGGDSADAWQILYRAMDRQKAGDDVVILAVGDPDFDTPQPIIDAAINGLQTGATHYTDVVGDAELRTIIANWHSQSTGQNVSKAQVVVMNGAQCALYGAAQCIMEAGAEVIIPEPMYTTYEALFNATGAKVIKVPMRPENNFQVLPEDIAAAVTDKTTAILINSPNNPTGAVFPRSTMEAVAEICKRHDLWLISDEVYSTVTFGTEHFSPCALPGMAERTITINSLSKSHAMTGWRLGWVVCPEEMALHLGNLTLCMLFGSPAFIQDAAKVALTTKLPELEQMRQTYQRRRDVFYQQLKNIEGIHCHLPEAGMFLMVDIRETGMSSQDMAELLLNKFDVATLPGVAFGPSGEGHIRVSLGVSEEDLVKASHRIAACIDYIQANKRQQDLG
ncbi:aminotransferase class I/II-fold pyridoxal phosphate-dependent enzyme [Colwellia sp. PAMC 21821]|uniref:pyridoxal phosphate-dependent aminotransferase n=1 Tax=Colwellia sp. PAMC 21821 TaxID=1816219 RepID=UPI0009BEC3FE|nr:aminotransferase class I/II-fold pyridoxal phosphate-dependent enzyme [Colwellia sp. PAMC 21821]ARD43847.1 aspartate aminotransferase [Colwellia sp. PAMC 21821]